MLKYLVEEKGADIALKNAEGLDVWDLALQDKNGTYLIYLLSFQTGAPISVNDLLARSGSDEWGSPEEEERQFEALGFAKIEKKNERLKKQETQANIAKEVGLTLVLNVEQDASTKEPAAALLAEQDARANEAAAALIAELDAEDRKAAAAAAAKKKKKSKKASKKKGAESQQEARTTTMRDVVGVAAEEGGGRRAAFSAAAVVDGGAAAAAAAATIYGRNGGGGGGGTASPRTDTAAAATGGASNSRGHGRRRINGGSQHG